MDKYRVYCFLSLILIRRGTCDVLFSLQHLPAGFADILRQPLSFQPFQLHNIRIWFQTPNYYHWCARLCGRCLRLFDPRNNSNGLRPWSRCSQDFCGKYVRGLCVCLDISCLWFDQVIGQFRVLSVQVIVGKISAFPPNVPCVPLDLFPCAIIRPDVDYFVHCKNLIELLYWRQFASYGLTTQFLPVEFNYPHFRTSIHQSYSLKNKSEFLY